MRAYERFLNYIAFDTQSDEFSETCPSTAKQLELAKFLKQELTDLGAKDIVLDDFGYIYATIPASKGCEKQKTIAFLAHMDTAQEMPGKAVNARIIEHYDGGDVVLNQDLGIVTDVKTHSLLNKNIGEDLIVTDGTTLLGCDDKGGLAGIMTAAEGWLQDNAADNPDPAFRHPEIRIVFTPDEEIGRGVDHIDLNKINASYAYTIDGEGIEALEYECFNGAAAVIKIKGSSVHPGDAYALLNSASLMAFEFHSLLPFRETPSATFGRYGFFHLTDITGGVDEAEMHYILRDHDKAELDRRKEFIQKAADFMNYKYGNGSVTFTITDSYPNMIEYILPEHEIVLTAARKALTENGLTPDESPIRGGTDGSRLSSMGLPCPNLGAGCMYCHGAHEYTSIQMLDKVADIVKSVAKVFADLETNS